MMTMSNRLRLARIAAGYPSAAQAARHLRIPYGTYSGHESGSRGFGSEEAALYAQAFGVAAAWLTFGEPPGKGEGATPDQDLVRLTGSVGQTMDGIVTLRPDPEYMTIIVPDICAEPTDMLLVEGPGIRHIATPGSAILYDRNMQDLEDDYFGSPCVCWLSDHAPVVGVPQPGGGAGGINIEEIFSGVMRDKPVSGLSLISAILTPLGYKRARFVEILRVMQANNLLEAESGRKKREMALLREERSQLTAELNRLEAEATGRGLPVPPAPRE